MRIFGEPSAPNGWDPYTAGAQPSSGDARGASRIGLTPEQQAAFDILTRVILPGQGQPPQSYESDKSNNQTASGDTPQQDEAGQAKGQTDDVDSKKIASPETTPTLQDYLAAGYTVVDDVGQASNNRRPKKFIAIASALAVVAGVTAANNDNVRQWIGGKIEAQQTQTAELNPEQLKEIIDELIKKTALGKPLNPEPARISQESSGVYDSMIYTPIQYDYQGADGSNFIVDGGIRLVLDNPLMQITYRIDKEGAQSNVTLDDSGKVVIQSGAINLNAILLQAVGQKDETTNDDKTRYKPIGPSSTVWGIANQVGNQQVKEAIISQNPSFSDKEIADIITALNNNQEAIAKEMITATLKKIFSDPITVQSIKKSLNTRIASDINSIYPLAQISVIEISDAEIEAMADNLIGFMKASNPSGGVKSNGQTAGVKSNLELSN